MIYTHLINFENKEFIVKTASTLKEDEELIKAALNTLQNATESKSIGSESDE